MTIGPAIHSWEDVRSAVYHLLGLVAEQLLMVAQDHDEETYQFWFVTGDLTRLAPHGHFGVISIPLEDVKLLDPDEIEEAFSLFNVDLTPNVLKILYGQHTTEGHYISEENWAILMLHALQYATPWRFAAALVAGKRLRLLWFPHQTQQRKASLMLTMQQNLPSCLDR